MNELGLCIPPRMLCEKDTGEVKPDRRRSSSPSPTTLPGASRSPIALVLIDPMAGATFIPSKEPILNRGRMDTEFVADVIDSVGLPGRGGPG